MQSIGSGSIALFLTIGFAVCNVQAQEIIGVTLDATAASIDTPLKAQITFDLQRYPNPYCGVEIVFGDGESQQIRVGANGMKDFPYIVSHTYRNTGSYSITVSGVFIARGLRSATPCLGKTVTTRVSVGNPAYDKAAEEAEKKSKELTAKELELQQLKAQLEEDRKRLEIREAEVQMKKSSEAKIVNTTISQPQPQPQPQRPFIPKKSIDPF